ncbi:MAG: DNA repair protein RecN [bacterium]
MLERLSVSNFAIIDRVDLSFRPGMTVLTGETGAGKSLLIDAISLIAGDRANQEMIRSGADKAEIEAVFTFEDDKLINLLNQYKIDHADRRLSIRREITVQNRNVIRINDQNVSLQQLKEIASHLVDVHTQFDNQRLIDPANYLDLIDGFKPDVSQRFCHAYLESLAPYRDALRSFRELRRMKTDLADKLDLYRHQIAELDRLNLRAGEEKELAEESAVLANFDKINASLQEVNRLFTETDTLSGLYGAASELERLTLYGEDLAAFHAKVKDAYYELDDIATEIKRKIRDLNFDADRFASVEARIDAIADLTSKYHRSVPELLEYREEIASAVEKSDHFDDYLAAASNVLHKAFAACLAKAGEWTKVRKEIAARIERELKVVFAELALPGTAFSIVFHDLAPTDPEADDRFRDTGLDDIDFFVSTNLGEPLKPLAKTASGGEMSRIMLAFKTIFIKSQNLSTIVFDEIDTGISGIVARQIAAKIKAVSASCQVIAISHIPQVVAAATHQLHVVKREIAGRTIAEVAELDFDARVASIAEMLSGVKSSPSGTLAAKELLLNA